jgi:GxxExxY protein
MCGDSCNTEEIDREQALHPGDEKASANRITGEIIGAAIEVHKVLGPGLLESAYEECLCHELGLRGVAFERQVPLPLEYKGITLDCGYRLDLIVEDHVIVELKSVNKIDPIHEAQLLTYLRLKRERLGLIINFNAAVLKDGVRRIVNG